MTENHKEQEFCGSSTIALLFGVTTRRVQQMVNTGIIEAEKKGNVYRYNLTGTVQCYIRYLSDKLEGKEEEPEKRDSESRKLKAEAELKEHKAKMAKLQLQELEGKMHNAEDVEAMTQDLVYAVRGAVLAMPGRLAVDLSELNNPPEISERIQKEVFAILKELSAYQYDPVKYRTRVMNRQGWDFVKDDDE